MKQFMTFLMLLGCVQAYAQSGFPTYNYQFSSDILRDLLADTSRASLKYQIAAAKLSYIGEYSAALAIWDMTEERTPTISDSEYNYIKNCKAYSAKIYIIDQVKGRQIIMINEEHHNPRGRVFTESMLADLYKVGFRYFGAETLGYEDPNLNERGYPFLISGTYTVEPAYGNLVRTALKTGFKVFSYEQDFNRRPNEEREFEQARNIKKILTQDPKAKILIHCGYGHLAKYNGYGKRTMAHYLKVLTDIDPYCIDQTNLVEKSIKEYEKRTYKVLEFDKYAIFEDSSGVAFHGYKKSDTSYNILVYHPRSQWVQGRPHWVFENGREPFMLPERITIDYPCMVFAYPASEDILFAVPVDIVELKMMNEQKALALGKGKYTIVIKNKRGQTQKMFITR